jgi:ankyrin repeat protein
MDLLRAIRYGVGYGYDLEKVKLLIDNGADVNYSGDSHGWTSLFWAVYHDRIDICILLIDSCADVNHKDKSGWTPLLIAVYEGKINIIKLLVTSGANVKHNIEIGLNTLYYALRFGDDTIANILRWRGAKYSDHIITNIDILLLLIYFGTIPRDILREIHTKWLS